MIKEWEELEIVKEEFKKDLFRKYEQFQNYNKNLEPKMGEGWVAATIFNIDYQNKSALYFLLLGLKNMENEIKNIKEEDDVQ